LMEAISLFDENYGKGTEKKALADYNQSAVSSGLSGSTRGAGVSTGMKQGFEDVRRGRLGDALAQLAQFLSSFQSGAPNAGNLGYIATGGFGAQSNLEAQRFAQDQVPTVANRNSMGSRSQPQRATSTGVSSSGSSGSSGSSSPYINYPGSNSSGSAQGYDNSGGGGAWGGLSAGISEQQENRPRQTIAGMWATKDTPPPPEPADAPAPWSTGSAYQGVPGGGYWY